MQRAAGAARHLKLPPLAVLGAGARQRMYVLPSCMLHVQMSCACSRAWVGGAGGAHGTMCCACMLAILSSSIKRTGVLPAAACTARIMQTQACACMRLTRVSNAACERVCAPRRGPKLMLLRAHSSVRGQAIPISLDIVRSGQCRRAVLRRAPTCGPWTRQIGPPSLVAGSQAAAYH